MILIRPIPPDTLAVDKATRLAADIIEYEMARPIRGRVWSSLSRCSAFAWNNRTTIPAGAPVGIINHKSRLLRKSGRDSTIVEYDTQIKRTLNLAGKPVTFGVSHESSKLRSRIDGHFSWNERCLAKLLLGQKCNRLFYNRRSIAR